MGGVCVCVAEAPEQPVRDKLDGRADTEGHHTVLRVCAGATESPLPQHTLLKGGYCTSAAAAAEPIACSAFIPSPVVSHLCHLLLLCHISSLIADQYILSALPRAGSGT